ncbi:MAG: hypothetical protein OXJ90_03565 [Spirochaetaceae bacterium]|nr:hypothetical protein [Spirochaetaceae bacterium]
MKPSAVTIGVGVSSPAAVRSPASGLWSVASASLNVTVSLVTFTAADEYAGAVVSDRTVTWPA